MLSISGLIIPDTYTRHFTFLTLSMSESQRWCQSVSAWHFGALPKRPSCVQTQASALPNQPLCPFLHVLHLYQHKPIQPHANTHWQWAVSGLLSKSVKWPVLSPSCHTQALSVQTPKLSLSSHLHLSSSPDFHVYRTQAARLKAFLLSASNSSLEVRGRMSPDLAQRIEYESHLH